MSDRVQVVDKRINLAQIFATAFLGFELAFAQHDCQIANFMQPLARQTIYSFR